jgi:thiosulfate/3-mercaptopyruvate sulfurtransferase
MIKTLEKSAKVLFKVSVLMLLPFGAVHASEFLVDTKWLQQNLNNPKVKIIEVSVNPGQFERGHIPGAVNFKWHTDLVDPVRRDIVTAKNLQDKLRKAGVSQDSTIVLYGDNNNWFAAWGAWVFDVYGIRNVKLLDGGRTKWEADKLPLSARSQSYSVGNISVNGANHKLRARLVDVLKASNNKTAALVDIRSADEYNGKIFAPNGVQELSIRAGHIPGAVNVPWSQAVAADGTFKSKEELRKIYANVGVDGKKPVITYCRIGERSSHTWFALSKILGYDVKNYDGSWTEYGNTVGLPIKNNAGTVWGAL